MARIFTAGVGEREPLASITSAPARRTTDRQYWSMRSGGSGGSLAATSELLAAENEGWTELHDLIDSLTPLQAELPGYYSEGWSVKDLLAHIGTWLAEAGVCLERIAAGTYRPEEIDVDAMNRAFLEAMKDLPFRTVHAQAWAARNRMLGAWRTLEEPTPDAAFWIRKSGPEHCDQHLPRLREWVTELNSS
jgi:hypothetical protein